MGGDVPAILDGGIDEKLCLDPAVDRFHRAVLGRRAGIGHRPRDIVWEKELVEGLRRVHGPVVGMEYRLHVRVFPLQLEEAAWAFEIAFPVAFSAPEAVAYDLVVPEIHVKGELPIPPARPKRRHVADDDLHGAGEAEGREDQVRVRFRGWAALFVPVMPRGAPYPGVGAASPGVFVAHDEPGIEPYLRVEPSVAMRWEHGVVF